VNKSLAGATLLTRREGSFFRDCSPAEAMVRRGGNQREPVMKTYFDDIAAAIVLLTYCVASASTVVAVFAGSI
jgi:hypothetical protein